MKRSKKLYILAGVLLAVCILIFGISQIKEKQEDIKVSGETILTVPASSVTSFTWEKEGQESMTFRRENDKWIYEQDELFPVSGEKIENMLKLFEDFGAAFIIESPEDVSQYGLENPCASIHLKTDDTEYDIKLGDYSKMDEQRYVSLGDGNAYLAAKDPMETFDAKLSDLILHDSIPAMNNVQSVQIIGEEIHEIVYQAEGGPSYRKDDVWFSRAGDTLLPLDPDSVSSYLRAIGNTYLLNYTDYNADDEELAAYGLDHPELSITVSFSADDQNEQPAEPFTMHISRDPKEVEKLDAESENSENPDEEKPVSAYVRIGDSRIVYRLDSTDYEKLAAYTYNDLRHKQVLPSEFEDIRELSFTLEGSTYSLKSEGSGDKKTWHYNDSETDVISLKNALTAITVNDFTAEHSKDKLEISFTAALDLENDPQVTVSFYRCNGDSCIAEVDGSVVGLVARSKVIDLIEAVNSIVLN